MASLGTHARNLMSLFHCSQRAYSKQTFSEERGQRPLNKHSKSKLLQVVCRWSWNSLSLILMPLCDLRKQTRTEDLLFLFSFPQCPPEGCKSLWLHLPKVTVSMTIARQKEAGGDFSVVNFIFYVLFCGFNGGKCCHSCPQGPPKSPKYQRPLW